MVLASIEISATGNPYSSNTLSPTDPNIVGWLLILFLAAVGHGGQGVTGATGQGGGEGQGEGTGQDWSDVVGHGGGTGHGGGFGQAGQVIVGQ